MSFFLRLSDEDAALLKKYAELNGTSVSEFVRQAVLERIEDEYDLKAYQKAKAGYLANAAIHTLDEAEKELGLK